MLNDGYRLIAGYVGVFRYIEGPGAAGNILVSICIDNRAASYNHKLPAGCGYGNT